MLIRALIIMLVFLNVGVAGWWLSRAAPGSPAVEQRRDVALLELVQLRARPASSIAASLPVPAVSTARSSTSAPARVQPTAAPATQVADGMRCLALGPFEDQPGARSALERLSPGPRAATVRSEALPAKAYIVLLPPLADHAAAQAMARRIAAAGFDDLMVIERGPATNGVALGRYGSHEVAMRRQAELQAGGFAAQLQPVNQGMRWWLDVELKVGEVELARRQTRAARAVPRDCG